MNMPSPILVMGDQYISKNNIVSIKRKYGDFYRAVTISATNASIDEIRTEAGLMDFLSQPKIIIINELPNQKAVREALIDLVSEKSDSVKFIIWDSDKAIKFDPKTKTINKTWGEFVDKFKAIPESKVINNGADFTDKDEDDCISLVKERFFKNKKVIGDEAAKIFVSIVGKERGLLLSEIEKLSLCCPEKLTTDFILDNTFPTSKDAVLYKFGNALDGNYSNAVVMLDQFLEIGLNANVLAEIVCKKARWQLAACYFYSLGMSWYDIDREIVNMGKFPSVVWANKNMSYDKKQKMGQECETPEGFESYKATYMGLPDYYFSTATKKTKKSKVNEEEDEESDEKATTKKKQTLVLGKKETLPLPFLATQMTTALQNNYVKPNTGKMDAKEIRVKLLEHALNVYLECINKLKEIRYGENPNEDLYEMLQTITNRVI
jgi:DNA polymerase III delta subunit